jgi:inosine-uridine nucleoside N-ribohydrolase
MPVVAAIPTAIPLLLDTDIGDDVDDVFALLLAARQSQVRLLGVTTVYGDVAQRARIARKLLRLSGHHDVPVVTGHSRTLAGRDPGPVLASGVGFADDDEPAGKGANAGAVEFLIDRVMTSQEPPVLVAVGPLTNVGAALSQEPRLAARLRALIVMGGRLGADAERGEHNVNCDPEATRLVLESGARLRLGTYEITVQARLAAADAERLRATGDAACSAAAAMLDLYLQHMARSSTAMYDPLTLTLAYSERFLTMQPAALVATYAQQRVTLVARNDATAKTDVSMAADAAAFIDHMLNAICLRPGADSRSDGK